MMCPIQGELFQLCPPLEQPCDLFLLATSAVQKRGDHAGGDDNLKHEVCTGDALPVIIPLVARKSNRTPGIGL